MAKDLFYYLSRRVGRAIRDFDLINESDRILVAVSGGKDSFAMVDLLLDRRRKSPVSFDLIFAHICMDDRIEETVSKFFKDREIPIEIDRDTFKEIDLEGAQKNRCFLCSWYRRKALFTIADRFMCNKVALGHNMDDVVESFLMNVFFQRSISSMCPYQELFGAKIVIIRPLVYIKDEELRQLSRMRRYPDVPICRWAKENKREDMRFLLKYLRHRNPKVDVVKNAFLSLLKVNEEYLPKIRRVEDES